ncbi:protein-export protein SecB [Agaricicola taiwanensis]|uniref:Protein-export protein SecB n=1 Tax=Agaricicola taiwanensis TaxID=591372 RepID=A0A8J2YFF3_9RHOB|nr:protein-export chaperone SecB [Agaricicola taiwanensis]GGE28859.1 protein-export protein SecB [Agaricicola taiwanensis]
MSTTDSPAQPQGPMLSVLAQYVKDLSFENPNAPRSLGAPGQSPNIQIQVDVNAQGLSESDVEVVLKIDAEAKVAEGTLFKTELVYGGVFRIQGVSPQEQGPIVLIECPRLLFPFARQIIAEAIRNGGFPPLMIDPIDFAQLYRQRLAQQQAELSPETSVN